MKKLLAIAAVVCTVFMSPVQSFGASGGETFGSCVVDWVTKQNKTLDAALGLKPKSDGSFEMSASQSCCEGCSLGPVLQFKECVLKKKLPPVGYKHLYGTMGDVTEVKDCFSHVGSVVKPGDISKLKHCVAKFKALQRSINKAVQEVDAEVKKKDRELKALRGKSTKEAAIEYCATFKAFASMDI